MTIIAFNKSTFTSPDCIVAHDIAVFHIFELAGFRRISVYHYFRTFLIHFDIARRSIYETRPVEGEKRLRSN